MVYQNYWKKNYHNIPCYSPLKIALFELFYRGRMKKSIMVITLILILHLLELF